MCRTCGSSKTSSMVCTGANGTSLASSAAIQCARGFVAMTFAQQPGQLDVVLDAQIARGEPRIVDQLGPLERDAAALPELRQRRELNGEQPAVAAAPRERVRVGDARQRLVLDAAAGEGGERVRNERDGGLQHVDLDAAAPAGALALVQRAQDAVAGIHAAGVVRDGRAADLRRVRDRAAGSPCRSAPARHCHRTAARCRARRFRSR